MSYTINCHRFDVPLCLISSLSFISKCLGSSNNVRYYNALHVLIGKTSGKFTSERYSPWTKYVWIPAIIAAAYPLPTNCDCFLCFRLYTIFLWDRKAWLFIIPQRNCIQSKCSHKLCLLYFSPLIVGIQTYRNHGE